MPTFMILKLIESDIPPGVALGVVAYVYYWIKRIPEIPYEQAEMPANQLSEGTLVERTVLGVMNLLYDGYQPDEILAKAVDFDSADEAIPLVNPIIKALDEVDNDPTLLDTPTGLVDPVLQNSDLERAKAVELSAAIIMQVNKFANS